MSDPAVAAAFAKYQPWVTKFRLGDHEYGGGFDAPNDPRLALFWESFPQASSILELGSLEGGHTIGLGRRPGVEQVLGLEGRPANLARARAVKEMLKVSNVEFAQANLEEVDLAAFGHFDVIFCCGLLYHLPEPWKLVEQFSAVANGLFLWTHCAAEEAADIFAAGYKGQRQKEGGAEEALSGLSPDSFWPTLGSLCKMLSNFGFTRLHILSYEPAHVNGPAITLAAYM